MIQRKKKMGKLMRMLLTLAAVWMLMGCMAAFAQESDGQLPNGKSVYNLLLIGSMLRFRRCRPRLPGTVL